MKPYLAKSLLFAVCAIFLTATAVTTASAETRVVVTGEDSNKRSVVRSSEIFKRVISQLQESLSRSGYFVIDEDMLAVRLQFSINNRRPKAELMETLQVANETEDAVVQSRFAVVFAIFPKVKKFSAFRKLEVRIRGDVYDLKTLRPLATFEYKSKKAYTISANAQQCDEGCVEEKIGDNAREIARELGDVLVQRLDIAIASIGGSRSSASKAASNVGLPITYNLKLIRFKTPMAMEFKQSLSGVSGIKSIKTLSVRSSERTLALETAMDIGLLEEHLYQGLMDAGFDVKAVRVEMGQTEISIENLAR